jgi:hypothetical protein
MTIDGRFCRTIRCVQKLPRSHACLALRDAASRRPTPVVRPKRTTQTRANRERPGVELAAFAGGWKTRCAAVS